MTWGLGEAKTERSGQLDCCVKLHVCERFGRKCQEIVNISLGVIFSTVAVVRTTTGGAQVVGAGERRQAGPKEMDDSPDNPQRGQRGTPISEAERGIQKDLAAPSNREED